MWVYGGGVGGCMVLGVWEVKVGRVRIVKIGRKLKTLIFAKDVIGHRLKIILT
jgi:hypothetical protein